MASSSNPQLTALEQKIKDIEKTTKSLERKTANSESQTNTAITKLVSDQKWHAKIGWAVIVLFAGAFSWLLTFYIPGKINDNIPTDFKERFGKIENGLATLQDQLNHLTPSTLNRLIPSSDTNIDPKLLAQQLQQASGIIDVALTSHIPAADSSIFPLRARLGEIRKKYGANSPVTSVATSADVRLDAYQLVSSKILNGEFKPITNAGDAHAGQNDQSILMNFGIICNPQLDQSFLKIDPGLENNVVVFRVRVNGCKQKMKGPRWIDTSFKDATLEYNGGPLYFADVTFTNCTFKFGSDPDSVVALSAIKSSGDKPVNLLIAQ